MILVTGATGLIGSHLILNLLKTNKNIVAIKRESSNINKIKTIFSFYEKNYEELFSKIIWREADILNFDEIDTAFADIDYVYHCAAIVSFNPKDKKIVLKNNVEGTENIVNAALNNRIKKLCHVSSIAALGGKDNEVITEESQRDINTAKSFYSESKYRSELEIWRGIEEGLKAVIVNPSVVIGPTTDWKNGSPSIFYNIWKGLKFFTNGSTGYVDVKDVTEIMIKLMNSNIENQRFILSSENLTYKDFLTKIANNFNIKPPKFEASKTLLNLAWRMDKIKSFLPKQQHHFTKEVAKSALETSFYSNTKIIETLNYEFIKIDESIENAAKYFLNQYSKDYKKLKI